MLAVERITYIYYQIDCPSIVEFSGCLELKELPISIDKLITLSIVGVLGVDGVTYIYQQID